MKHVRKGLRESERQLDFRDKSAIRNRKSEIPLSLISRHNINASDALYLHQALNLQRRVEAEEHELVLVASDQRLLRAAENEGLITLIMRTRAVRAISRIRGCKFVPLVEFVVAIFVVAEVPARGRPETTTTVSWFVLLGSSLVCR